MVHQLSSNRAREIDAQFQNLDNRLDQVSEDLERAEGNATALQDVQQAIQKDRRDLQDLRQIVVAVEYNLQRQKHLAGPGTESKASSEIWRKCLLLLCRAQREVRSRLARHQFLRVGSSTVGPSENSSLLSNDSHKTDIWSE
ncbi:Mannosyltransferase 1 CMT1 [Penicillium expansum]|nr:Mannosyltransferase 1 CMT1 [Penicillium expansum]